VIVSLPASTLVSLSALPVRGVVTHAADEAGACTCDDVIARTAFRMSAGVEPVMLSLPQRAHSSYQLTDD
jgi:hypothetical protein